MHIFQKTTISILTLALLCICTSTFGQQMPTPQTQDIEVSDEELQIFVDISSDLREMQNDIRIKMVKILDSSDLGREKFSQIAQSYQSGTTEQADFTEEEMKLFQEVNQQLQPLQMESQQSAMQAINDSEMEIQRFQIIAGAIQQDQELQQRYMAIIQEQGN